MIVFQCQGCKRELRALDGDQAKRGRCPCGFQLWIPGEASGLWIGLFQPLIDKFGWKCPHCQQRIGVQDESCKHCNGKLPTLVKGE
jgi:hypothetical protein